MTDRAVGRLLELTADECLELVATAPVSRVGFVLDGELHILPVAHVVLDGRVCFKSAPGSKLGAAAGGAELVLQADRYDEQAREGWSVVARGAGEIVTDRAVLARLMALDFEPWALPGDDAMWVRVDVTGWTGRRIVH